MTLLCLLLTATLSANFSPSFAEVKTPDLDHLPLAAIEAIVTANDLTHYEQAALERFRNRQGKRIKQISDKAMVLLRQYHGREIRVLTLDDGFEYDGQRFRSLSAVARSVTGQRWNGLLFFGLTKRKRS